MYIESTHLENGIDVCQHVLTHDIIPKKRVKTLNEIYPKLFSKRNWFRKYIDYHILKYKFENILKYNVIKNITLFL